MGKTFATFVTFAILVGAAAAFSPKASVPVRQDEDCVAVHSTVCDATIPEPGSVNCASIHGPPPFGWNYVLDPACVIACRATYDTATQTIKDTLCELGNTLKDRYLEDAAILYEEAEVEAAECGSFECVERVWATYMDKRNAGCEVYNTAVETIQDTFTAAINQALADYVTCVGNCCQLQHL